MKLKDWDRHDQQDHSGFWVHPDECVFCGVCHPEAPGIFAWRNAHGSDMISTIVRQPDTQEEISGTINAMTVCCCECIYYGGKDAKILAELGSVDVHEECIIHA